MQDRGNEESRAAARETQYRTAGGFVVHRTDDAVDGAAAIDALLRRIDAERGAVFASSYEVAGRYARWDRGFASPPLAVEARGSALTLAPLNARGRVLLAALAPGLAASAVGAWIRRTDDDAIEIDVPAQRGTFAEEERSRQPSAFSVLRAVVALFAPAVADADAPADDELGLHGAFGYDLAFQFEPIRPFRARDPRQRDLVLYLADELVVVDHRLCRASRIRYEFDVGDRSTRGLPRVGARATYRPGRLSRGSDHERGEYAQVVRRARAAFARGDLFEVVPSQVFSEACPSRPSEVFRRLRARNPSPYGFLLNLGEDEYLVGASPEMYVRVSHEDGAPRGAGARPRRVETCPIAGTIARGADPLADAEQIAALLASEKDACELTMCTDVDRNDKSRVCAPETIRVLARRQIEMYSRLIHTVDHVEGILLPELDALDAFLAHAWAVTVTGAPKRAAMQFIEEHELSPRRYYGGAVGSIGFDGTLNTGLVLRTIRIEGGNAEVRVGATLLYDSDPDDEERETELKASALLDALRRDRAPLAAAPAATPPPGAGQRVLIVDAQDSFVHTLGGYFRRAGAKVKTLRAGFPRGDLARYEPDLVVLSPGPGRPEDFGLARVLDAAIARGLPVFGVCLGLQAIVEFCGGELGVLPEPVHGKASEIHVAGGALFRGFPSVFRAGRYHSLYARGDTLPPELAVTATDADGVVMAVEHASLRLAGVQFHPESILTQTGDLGMRLVRNALAGVEVRERAKVSRDVLSI